MERKLINAAAKIYCDIELDSKLLYADGTATHKKTSFACPSKGYKRCTHEFILKAKSKYVEVLNKVMLTADRRVRVRFGSAAGSLIAWGDWEWHRVLSCALDTANVSANDVPIPVVLVTADELASFDISSAVKAHQGLVSDQVAAIAGTYAFGGTPAPQAHR